MFAEQLESRADRIDMAARRAAVAELAKLKNDDRDTLDQMLAAPSEPMISCHVPHVCRQLFDDDAVVIFDGGNTAVWGNFFTPLRTPNAQLGTHHMGHLGAGVGQALGAAVARPDKEVYCPIGDGAMGVCPQTIRLTA
jgi:acetolactate synthase-1/2/3 large subunit